MPTKEIAWIVQNRMIENTSYENLPEIIEKLGYKCFHVNFDSALDYLDAKVPDSHNYCCIPYVTVPVARKFQDKFGMYLNENTFKYHVYTSLLGLPLSDYLNGDGVLTTYYNFKQRKDLWFVDNDQESVFIRPDSGMKLFTGFALEYQDFNHNINYLNTTALNDDSLIWVSRIKTFDYETRFVICGNIVVDGSVYCRDSGKDIVEVKAYPTELLSLAEKVAAASWKPAEVFTLDLCMTLNGPKIVELNSFNCSGLYACNMYKVVKAVSEHTLNLYNDI